MASSVLKHQRPLHDISITKVGITDKKTTMKSDMTNITGVTTTRDKTWMMWLKRDITRHKTDDGKCLTFHPKHRFRKLAIKDMMIQGYVVKRMKEKQASKDDRVIEEFRNKLEEDIQNHLKKISNMYVHLRKAPEPMLYM